MIKILKHICCLLIVFLLSALSFAQGVKENFSFEINNTFPEASIGPGDCINFSPTITNTGNIEGYVYFRLEQPVVIGESDTPLYTLDINNSWELRKEHILENKLISIYAYKDPLKPGQSTDPLCSQIQMTQIPIPQYSKLEDISFTITMYAEDDNSESIIFNL